MATAVRTLSPIAYREEGDTMKNLMRAGLMIVALVGIAAAAEADDAAQEAHGMKLFTEQKCSLCHMVGGKGNKNGPLDGVASKYKPEEIRKWITSPKEMAEQTKATRKPPMKVYTNLTPAEIDALVAYLSTLKKK
jgi:mono/diheme cytochrome c family protein